jgi:hypothetical protein
MVGVMAPGNAWKEWRGVRMMAERGTGDESGRRHPGRWEEDGEMNSPLGDKRMRKRRSTRGRK